MHSAKALQVVLRAGLALGAILPAGTTGATSGDPPVYIAYADADYDVVVRRTDADGVGTYDPAQHAPVELVEIQLGRWQPTNPQLDLFTGTHVQGGGFLRLALVLDGLRQPPGSTKSTTFEPFVHGPDPVYGFVEIDVDDDRYTGGEVDEPQYRYLANVARFGGLPEGDAFANRAAKEAADLDGNLLTLPHVERHGEEFHLALLGDQFNPAAVEFVAGDSDLLFEAGETWDLPGQWFHRAHAFEDFSIAGAYAPTCHLRFAHSTATNRTTLVLVFPLTNAAAASMDGTSPQPNNHNPSDQASINEALHDLVESAALVVMFPTGDPQEQLIVGWDGRGPGGYLQPAAWRLTALLGMSYSTPGFGFVWTDAWPNPLRGNVNGENGVNHDDADELEDYIEYHDLEDGVSDDRVLLDDFAANFSVFDVSQDGVIDALDVLLASKTGDADGDADVDLADYARFQLCLGWTPQEPDLSCGRFDLDGDGSIDARDLRWFGKILNGPGSP